MSARTFLTAALLATSASGHALTLTAGIVDDFASPGDTASPSAAFIGSLATQGGEFSGGVQGFDLTLGINGGNADRQIAHTFMLPLTGVSTATLTVRVKGGNESFVSTDGIALSFVNNGAAGYLSQVAYSRTFGGDNNVGSALFNQADPGLLQSAAWASDSDVTFILNLAALPLVGGGTLNLLAQLNTHGFLDVNVSDDSAVDFMTLEVTAVPLPAAIYPLLSGLALLGLRGRAR